MPKNKPGIPHSKFIPIDIELQQETQIQIVQHALVKEQSNAIERKKIEGLDLNELINKIKFNELNIRLQDALIKKTELLNSWHAWLGNVYYTAGKDSLFPQDTNSNRPRVKKISVQAAEQLLAHRDYFKAGINSSLPKYLLRDFHLVPEYDFWGNENGSLILHYDPKTPSINRVFSAEIKPKAERFPVPAVDRLKITASLPETSKLRHYLTTITDPVLNDFLPQLWILADEQIDSLFTFSSPQNSFNPALFRFMVENYSVIAEVFRESQGPCKYYDSVQTEILLANSVLERQLKAWPISSDACIQLALKMSDSKPAHRKALIEILLESQPRLLQKFHSWNKLINFTPQQMNALLQVWNAKGVAGIEELFALWQKVDQKIVLSVLKTAYKETQSFNSLLTEEDDLKAASELLKGIEAQPLANQWWKALFAIHCQHHKEINLLSLAKAFNEFAATIKRMNLKFYPLTPNPFPEASNLITTLARMLEIVNFCGAQNTEDQFYQLSAIPYGPASAIRFFADRNGLGERGGFVIPVMKTIPYEYQAPESKKIKVGNWSLDGEIDCLIKKGYATEIPHLMIKDWESSDDGINEKVNMEEVRRHFYRFVAAQPYNLPLSFYLKVDEEIKKAKLIDPIATYLYTIVARGTTGKENVERPADLQQIENAFQELLHLTKGNFSTSIMVKAINLKNDLICKCFRTLANSDMGHLGFQNLLAKQSVASYENIGNAFMKMMFEDSQHNAILKFHKIFGASDFNRGFMHYGWQDIRAQQDPLVFRHLLFVDAALSNSKKEIFKKTPVDFGDKLEHSLLSANQLMIDYIIRERCKDKIHTDNLELKKKFLPLMSLFKLCDFSKENIASKAENLRVLMLQDNRVNKKALAYAFAILAQIVKPHKKFNYDFLYQFIVDFREKGLDASKDVLGFIEKNVGQEHFPAGFFTTGQNSLSASVKEIIADHSKIEQKYLEQILLHFVSLNANHDQLKSLAINLSVSLDSLYEEEEKDRVKFLQKLAAQPFLAEVDFERFNALINYLKVNSARNFIYFYELAVSAGCAEKGLVAKLHLFYCELLPHLYKTCRLELIPALQDLAIEILSPIDINPEETQQIFPIIDRVARVISLHSSERELLKRFIINCIHQAGYEANSFKAINEIVSNLEVNLGPLEPADVQALCMHFNYLHGKYTCKHLLEIFNKMNDRSREQNKVLLKILVQCLNSEKDCSVDAYLQIIERCQQDNEFYLNLCSIYEKPLFPPLEFIASWIENPKDCELLSFLDQKKLDREKKNGFKLKFAEKQAPKIQGVKFSKESLAEFKIIIDSAQLLTNQELLDKLELFKEKKIVLSNAELIAYTAEMLHRAKGLPAEYDEQGKQKLGRSFEINTTQYLALYAMLERGRKVGAEVGTGEGKTRLLMILAACRYFYGETVIFTTKDRQLSTREFQEFQSFFRALRIKLSLLQETSDYDAFQLNGVTITNHQALRLMRNKALFDGEMEKLIQENPDKRCLIVDEADDFCFDWMNKRFNFSHECDETIINIPWVYTLLIEYQESVSAELALDSEKFLNYVAFSAHGQERVKRLQQLSPSQINIWLESAKIARSFRYKEDYLIEPGQALLTSRGLQNFSRTLVYRTRVEANSKFSAGIEQCLAAYLNLRKQRKITNPPDNLLDEVLADCLEFYIDNQKQIILSSTVKTTINEEGQGSVYLMTGTLGDNLFQEEINILFNEEMHFIAMPRHNGLKRHDYPLFLARDRRHQYEHFIKEIMEAKASNRPVLLIMEDEKESTKIYNYLKKNYPKFNESEFTHLSCQLDSVTEANHIKRVAGRPGMVTISTPMSARGTDIRLTKEAAKNGGLRVIAGFMPTSARDYEQIISRGGRFGDRGDSRFILRKPQFAKFKNFSFEQYYLACEDVIKHQQKLLERKDRCFRLTQFTISDFRDGLTARFFNFYPLCEPSKKQAVLKSWSKFIANIDRHWTEQMGKLAKPFSDDSTDVAFINEKLLEHSAFAQKEWRQMRIEIAQVLSKESIDELKETIPKIEINERFHKFFAKIETTALKPPVIDEYDPAYDGKAKAYSSVGAWLKACWQQPLFADIRASFTGVGTAFPIFRALCHQLISFWEWLVNVRTKQKAPDREIISSPIEVKGSSFSMLSSLQGAEQQISSVESGSMLDPKYSGGLRLFNNADNTSNVEGNTNLHPSIKAT